MTQALFASVDGRVADLGDGECIFRPVDGGASHVMTHDVLAALDVMRRFGPLELHRERALERLPALQGQSEAFDKVFRFLLQRKLVRAAEDVARDWQTPMEPLTPPRFLAIRTADRHDQLARLLESLAAAHVQLPVVVVDDSRRRESVRANRELCAGSPLSIEHYAREDRARHLEKLSDANNRWLFGLEDQQIQTHGGAWNFITLLAAGQRFAMLDDDFVFEPKELEKTERRLELARSGELPIRVAPPGTDITGALCDATTVGFDEQIELCGRSGRELLTQLGTEPKDLLDVPLASLQELAHSHLLTTTGGVYGALRTDSSLGFHLQPAPMLRRLIQDESTYRHALSGAPAIHGARSFRIDRLAAFTPNMIDGRELLPPCFPDGRGEDYAFAVHLAAIAPDSRCLTLPVLLGHGELSASRELRGAHALQPDAHRMLTDLLVRRAGEFVAEDRPDRLRSAARIFGDFAASGAAGRQQVVAEYLDYLRSDLVRRLKAQLARHSDAPEYWQADVREWIEAQGEALIADEKPQLRDHPDDEQLARYADRWAAALGQWPDLWDRARDGN